MSLQASKRSERSRVTTSSKDAPVPRRSRSSSHRKLLMLLAVIDEQEKWREDFCHSMAEWLVARLSVSLSDGGGVGPGGPGLAGPPGDRRGGRPKDAFRGTSSPRSPSSRTRRPTRHSPERLPVGRLPRRRTSPDGPRPPRWPTPTRPTGAPPHLVARRPPAPPPRSAPDRGRYAGDVGADRTRLGRPEGPRNRHATSLSRPGPRDALVELAATKAGEIAEPDRPFVVVHTDPGALGGDEEGEVELAEGRRIAAETAGASPVTAAGSWSSRTKGRGGPPRAHHPPDPALAGSTAAKARPRMSLQRAAGLPAGSTPTTSPTGPTAERPITTIWSCSAAATTGWSTKAAGRSPRRGRAPSPSTNRTARSHLRATRAPTRRPTTPLRARPTRGPTHSTPSTRRTA